MAVALTEQLLFGGELVQNKDIYKIATFSKPVLLHSINLFGKDTFQTKILLIMKYFLRAATFWKKLNF